MWQLTIKQKNEYTTDHVVISVAEQTAYRETLYLPGRDRATKKKKDARNVILNVLY